MEALQFPAGGMGQFEVMKWVQDNDHEMKLVDGAYRNLSTPAFDGSHYQWEFGLLLVNDCHKSVNIGDWIVIGQDQSIDVVKPELFHFRYDEVGHA